MPASFERLAAALRGLLRERRPLWRLYLGLRRTLRGRRALVWLLLLGFVGPWLVFIKIAEEIWEKEGFPGDHYLLETLHQHATPTLDWLARALSTAGGPPAMLALTAALLAGLWALGRRLDAAFFLTAVGGAMVLNVLVKTVFGRARPALWATLDPTPFYSFPSGHAMGSAALAVALGFLVVGRRGRWPVWALSGLFLLGVGCTCCSRPTGASCGPGADRWPKSGGSGLTPEGERLWIFSICAQKAGQLPFWLLSTPAKVTVHTARAGSPPGPLSENEWGRLTTSFAA